MFGIAGTAELSTFCPGTGTWNRLQDGINAPSLAQFVIAPRRKDHSIVSFMAFRITRGDMCWETSQNVRFEDMGLGLVHQTKNQAFWTRRHGTSSL